MQFQFYALGDNATLDLIDTVKATGQFADIKLDLERYFDTKIVAAEARQVLVYCESLGKSPASFVAVEAIYLAHSTGKVKPEQQVRTLIWLVEENVPKRR